LIVDGGLKIIDDTYNASPDSMKSAIDYLTSFTDGRKIAVLAGMNELGEHSADLHCSVGKYAIEAGVDILAAIGEKGSDIAAGFVSATGKTGTVKEYGDNAEAIGDLLKFVKDGDIVLVKGSRAMKTEEIVDALRHRKSDPTRGEKIGHEYAR
jgi:UDP-N-acetylmuramoyl-tripeptide--D-alanyl-D-alanine ligase